MTFRGSHLLSGPLFKRCRFARKFCPVKMGVKNWGFWPKNVGCGWFLSPQSQKGTSLARKTPSELLSGYVASSVYSGGASKNPPKMSPGCNISPIRRTETPWGIFMKMGFGGRVQEVITQVNFYRYLIRGSGATGGRKNGLHTGIGRRNWSSTLQLCSDYRLSKWCNCLRFILPVVQSNR